MMKMGRQALKIVSRQKQSSSMLTIMQVTLMMVMGHNIPVPNFAAEYPGNTYYFSLLNVCDTGIIDVSTEDMHLHCYAWLEGEEKRDGNTIAS
eukprot:3616507-Ditylum_brightwellii.AAC.1